MEKGNEKRRSGIGVIFILLLLCLKVVVVPPSAEAASYNLKLRQIYINYPSATAYFDFRDAEGNCVQPNGTVSLNIGEENFKSEGVKQFSRKDEGVATVFTIDISSSISSKRFDELKNAISKHIKQMGPKDYAAIVSFGDSAKVVQDYTQEPKVLLYTVQQLKANNDNTAMNSGIISALNLAGINDSSLPKRRIVVLCSDGMDDSPLSATEGEVRSAIDKSHIPIYSVYFDAAKVTKPSRQKQVEAIGEFARRSGGSLYDAKSSPFIGTFEKIFKEVEGAYCATFNVENVPSEGQLQRASLTYSDGGLQLSDGTDVRIIKPKSNDEASSADAVSADAKGENLEGANWLMAMIKRLRANKAAFYGTIAGILIAVCGGIFLFVRSRRAKRKREKAAALFSDDSEPPTQAFSTGQEANTTQRITSGVRNDIRTQSIGSVTSGPSIDIELSVMGSKEHSEKYNVSIKDRLSIGRKGGGASDFGVPGDATISAKHCELVFSKGRLQVIDLGSTNGTYVNGSPIAGIYPLNDGDRLLLGKTELRIKITGIR